MTTSSASRFAASYVTLSSAHEVADYWVQTRHQAENKGRHGNAHEDFEGRQACLSHVAVYSGVSTAALCCINRAVGLEANWRGVLTGQLISGASHYFADRRFPLRRLAAKTGRLEFHDSTVGGPQLDQSWHRGWLAAAALATALIGQRSARY